MLKFAKASSDGIISVIVRDKEFLFTQPFAFAFIIAVALHLGLILLFHIAPIKIGLSQTNFPPVRVEADTFLKESVIAEVTPSIQTLRGLPSRPSSHPTLLQEPNFLVVRPMEYSQVEGTTTLAFRQIEKQLYEPEFNPLIFPSKPPLEMIISGVLAEHPLLSTGLNQKNIINGSHLKRELQLVYSVMVEGRTGKIFWFESKQSDNHFTSNQFAEKILNDMRFALNQTTIALSGEIEFHFNVEAK